jgi:hypothetical protein
VFGILIAGLLFFLVSSKVAATRISTLRFTVARRAAVDPPMFDLPLPTVVTVGVITALLVIGALYMIIRARQRSFVLYMGALISRSSSSS